jgi:hypothetical protein
VSQPQLDPTLIERYVRQLERKADSVRLGSAIFGGSLGAVLGAVPLSPLGDSLPVPARFVVATILVGGALGALLGHVVGDGRAFRIRVQAQLALLQLQAHREPAAPAYAPGELLPIRRPVLEAVPTPPESRRLEIVPPLSPTAGA